MRRNHPGPGRGVPVARRGEMGGGRLRPGLQQPGRAAVPADPHRGGLGPVGHLADDVVGEPEAVPLGHQQAGPDRPPGPAGAVLGVEPAEHRDLVECEGDAEHRSERQQQRRVGSGVGDAAGHGLLQRVRHRKRTARTRPRRMPQQLAEEQRRSAGPGVELLGVVPQSGAADQQRGVGRRQWTQLDVHGHVQQGRGHQIVLRAPLGHHDHRPAAGPTPGKQVQRLDARLTGMLRVLHDEQHRLVVAEPIEEPDQRLEAAPMLQLRSGARGRRAGGGAFERADQIGQLGQQHGERAQPAAGEAHAPPRPRSGARPPATPPRAAAGRANVPPRSSRR